MRLKRKLTVWSSALALSCAALSAGVAQAQTQQAQAPASAKQEEPERYGPFFFLRSEPDLLIYVGAVGANDMLNLKKRCASIRPSRPSCCRTMAAAWSISGWWWRKRSTSAA